MPENYKGETCVLCKRGTLTQEETELSIRQFTDKGNVQCRVSIPIAVCNYCDARTLREPAEQLIEDAIAAEYAKLP